jgi:starvation-inducible DNA-binding protein
MLTIRKIKPQCPATNAGAWRWRRGLKPSVEDGVLTGSYFIGGIMPSKELTHNGKHERVFDAKKSRPLTNQDSVEIQAFGTISKLPNGLSESVCKQSVERLNQILADTMALRDLYKKHHWQVAGPTFYQLHLLFDKHFEEQVKLVDDIAERIQLLGGLSIAMAHDVAENTNIPRPPKGREEVPVQISRLLTAHEIVIQETRETAGRGKAMDLSVSARRRR